MQDDNGSEQQGGWQPPEYVSPWASASGTGEGENPAASEQPWAPTSQPTQPEYQTTAFTPEDPANPGGGYNQGGYGQGGSGSGQAAWGQPAAGKIGKSVV